jgi:L-asparaginase
MPKKVKIAHFAGPNATITNTPPLVTSNKARAKHGLPLITDVEGNVVKFDVLRAQKLAAPVTVFVEQFSAHPLESDVSELYSPPDGYLNPNGDFSPTQGGGYDRPVYQVQIGPEDGFYPMPYMARQADGSAWETDGTSKFASRAESRNPFMPDGSRAFEEVDRLGVSSLGFGNMVSSKADVDFIRVAPSGGYTKQGEVSGKDFFPYRPSHLGKSPPRMTLARITNMIQEALSSGKYDGAIWTQGTPRIEETMYWLNLIIDTTVPICGNSAQRYHGMISNDGPKNIADSVDYIYSRVWQDEQGKNRAGFVMCQDQRIFAVREVTKVDARPGGYAPTGGHGGILGTSGGTVPPQLRYIPVMKHTYLSEVNINKLPSSVAGLSGVTVPVKDGAGKLLASAIPKVSIFKDASYTEDDYESDPMQEVAIQALIDYSFKTAPLSGFVLEGTNPYGKAAAASVQTALQRAAYMGFPVVQVGRGGTEGFAFRAGPILGGSNLTSIKARLLLMLCIMKFGMLPPAKDPSSPTAAEKSATSDVLDKYQAIFDTH